MVDFSRDQGLFCKKVDIKSDELFLFSDSITSNLLNEIKLFWSKSELYKENNLIHKRGILLEGYPGTGKSSIISILSNEIMKLGGVIFKVSGYRNLDHYIDFVRTHFRKIQPDTPIITILEDLDQYEDVEMELLDFLRSRAPVLSRRRGQGLHVLPPRRIAARVARLGRNRHVQSRRSIQSAPGVRRANPSR